MQRARTPHRSDHRSEKRRNRSGERPSGAPRKGRSRKADEKFILYVEGPRDRELLSTWSRRIDPELSRLIESSTSILGGRQPARAVEDFRKRGGAAAGWKGMVILDRDDQNDADAVREVESLVEEGLELIVWGQRHIESYLIVPSVLARLLGASPGDARVEEIVAAALKPDEHGTVHAKRLLGPGGSLSAGLGVELRAGEIARAMRDEELHEDVRDVFQRIARMAEIDRGPEVVVKSRADRSS